MKVGKKYLKSRKEKIVQALKITLIMVIFFGISFTYIYLKNRIMALNYSLNRAVSEKKKLLREKGKLERIILYFHSPSYLGERGKEMGMTETKVSDIRKIK